MMLFDAETGDADALAALHVQCFPDPWDAPAILALLATPGTFAYVEPDGFVMARVVADEAEILTLAVAPNARGRGLGRILMQAAAAHAQDQGAQTLFLEVGTENPPALALYTGLGFAKVGARKGYYSGRDALVFRLALA
jgi:ribosomal-protein-alanine N-acetyltransferase